MRTALLFCVVVAAVAATLCGCGGGSSSPAAAPLADAVAFFMQDGDGAWQQIEDPGTTFVPTVEDPQGRYGFAIATIYGSRNIVGLGVICTTTSETPSIDIAAAKAKLGAEDSVVITGTVSGLGMTETAKVAAGTDDYGTGSGGGTYRLDDYLTAGTYDVAAVKYSNNNYPTDMILKTGVSVSTGTNACNFDFSDAASVQTMGSPQTVTITNGTTQDASVYYVTPGGTQVPVGWYMNSTPAATFQYAPYVPDVRGIAPRDHYLADIFSQTGVQTAWLLQAFGLPGDESFALPALFNAGDVVMLSENGTLRGSATGLTYSNALGYSLQYRAESTSGVDYNTVAYVTPGWLGAQTTFTMPDLTGVTGWQSQWSLPATASVRSWTLAAQGASAGVTVNDLINWFLGGTPDLGPGEYITSAAKLDS